MPTVKGYGDLRVELQPIQGGRSTAQAAGPAAIGQALNQLGNKIYVEERDRQDQVAVMEADRKLSEWENKRMYDPQNGALNVRGKDAFGLPEAVNKDFEAAHEEIRASLTNDRQRFAFDKGSMTRRKDINTTLTRHVFNESRKFEEAETENYLKNSTQAAILNYNDPDRITTEIARAGAAVTLFAKRNGLGTEYEKQKNAQVRSTIHVGVIDRYISNGQDQAAKAYYNSVKTDIAGDDISKIEKQLDAASTEGEAQRGAADVWTRMKPKTDLDPVNLDKMYEEARKKYGNDPKVLKGVESYLSNLASVHNAAQRERHESNSSAVWQVVEAGAPLMSIQRLPQYRNLSGKEQIAIRDYVEGRADIVRRRADDQGDDALYYRLSVEASAPELQQQFVQTNLFEHRPKLSRAQFNRLVEIQSALRSGDGKAADKLLASERVQNQIVNDAILGMGLDPTPNEKYATTDRGKQVLDFRRQVRDSVRQFEISKGKNATDDEVQSIVDGLVVKGVTKKGIIFDDTKRVYELKPGENITIKASDVPPAERRKIEAALRRQGRVPTDEAVTTLYQGKLLRLRGSDVKSDDPKKRVPQ